MVGGSLEGNLTANEHRVTVVASHVDVKGTVFVKRESSTPLTVRDIVNSLKRDRKEKLVPLKVKKDNCRCKCARIIYTFDTKYAS